LSAGSTLASLTGTTTSSCVEVLPRAQL
jgi:hypothetical protein